MIAAIITGITTSMVAWPGARHSLPIALTFAGATFLGMYLSYGLDPRNDKKIPLRMDYSEDEIRQALENSPRIIPKIEQVNDKIWNAELNYRIKRICEIADCILAEIASDALGRSDGQGNFLISIWMAPDK